MCSSRDTTDSIHVGTAQFPGNRPANQDGGSAGSRWTWKSRGGTLWCSSRPGGALPKEALCPVGEHSQTASSAPQIVWGDDREADLVPWRVAVWWCTLQRRSRGGNRAICTVSERSFRTSQQPGGEAERRLLEIPVFFHAAGAQSTNLA
ncbi:hypothetical protein SKAU_G00283230 [Synaphobranchus kaupii]|uniref:Uncharacterized protein n=1 Tax=Synaphobranchus kaupii TaxID=118154 RepID=A0A9Q1EXG8_SYNKA|nr:hypothetical protein SKAU_G00283230 [Synaphobranchus kaupii]